MAVSDELFAVIMKQVQGAYTFGFGEGQKDFSTSRGGQTWFDVERLVADRMRRALEAAEAVRGRDAAPPAGVTISRALLSEILRKLRPLASHPDEKPAKMTEDDVLAAKQVYSALKAVEDRATAPSAAPPAGTVVVRVAVALSEKNHIPWVEVVFSDDEEAFQACERMGHYIRSCIATIHAPLPAVAEVGAVVENIRARDAKEANGG